MNKLLFFLLSFPLIAISQSTTPPDFNSSGAWVAQTGYTYNITVEAWGGGGGGGSISGAGGGGGGAYARLNYTNVPPGTYNVFVGAGGAAGNPGGNSSFSGTGIATLSAAFGSGSAGASGGAGGVAGTSGSVNNKGGDGGNAGSGFNRLGGGGGGGSASLSAAGGNGGNGASANGNNPAGGVGGIAGSGGGAGGKGSDYNGGAGDAVAGNSPGGGGGGGSNSGGSSKAGAAGRVRITVNSSLPIELSAFHAESTGKTAVLSWSTATESNNAYFSIERSGDGRAFTEIGKVTGAGTTREPQSYTFTDEKPLAGTNYYRLRQLDYDGTESFSPVVSVDFGKSGHITIAPSPATDRVRILLEEAFKSDAHWNIFDSAGREVLSGNWEAETAEYELEVNTLPEGMYTFRLVVGASVQVKQFRKL